MTEKELAEARSEMARKRERAERELEERIKEELLPASERELEELREEIMKKDDIDSFVRSLVGWKMGREGKLLVRLSRDPKHPPKTSDLPPSEREFVGKFVEREWARIDDGDIKLTALGESIARGGRSLHRPLKEILES